MSDKLFLEGESVESARKWNALFTLISETGKTPDDIAQQLGLDLGDFSPDIKMEYPAKLRRVPKRRGPTLEQIIEGVAKMREARRGVEPPVS